MHENEACFIDSNIWLYAFTDDDPQKKDVAQALIKTSQPVISAQVINEVCVNLIKRAKFPEAQINELIETFYQKYDVIELHKGLLLSASQLRREYALSYWDSIIVAAALASDVKRLYSEDMQHGLVIRKSLQVVNPFKA
ncbi:MAG: PIN domain-containing protein [Anaerolineales bacterium]